MKTLYLVRHAKSSWKEPHLPDFDRPLNKRGKKAAPVMGNLLKEIGIRPDMILSSPANRAITTARIFADTLQIPADKILELEEIYHADTHSLLNLIRKTDDSIGELMIFGHNPGFTFLAGSLTNHSIDNIPTAGVVGIRFDSSDWKSVERGKGKLILFEYPKKYQSPG